MDLAFTEGTDASRTVALPLAHLSIEVGHLYVEDFAEGRDRVVEMARAVVPWVEAAKRTWARTLGTRALRASTCFLIDDYFTPFSTPDLLIPLIVEAYAEAGLTLDYIARESACAQAGDIPLAELVVDHLVPDPPPGTDGSTRPDPRVSGWLANGTRAVAPGETMAMGAVTQWQPPRQNAVHRHSVFIDVQLWDGPPTARQWSCPFLAAVWQLVRLGALRHQGAAVVDPVPWSPGLAQSWSELPPVVRIPPRSQPFTAYHSFSVLDHRFIAVEHAVRAILAQVATDPDVEAQLTSRAGAEGLTLPSEIIDRISYAFV
jgi:hypothetical protein